MTPLISNFFPDLPNSSNLNKQFTCRKIIVVLVTSDLWDVGISVCMCQHVMYVLVRDEVNCYDFLFMIFFFGKIVYLLAHFSSENFFIQKEDRRKQSTI